MPCRVTGDEGLLLKGRPRRAGYYLTGCGSLSLAGQPAAPAADSGAESGRYITRELRLKSREPDSTFTRRLRRSCSSSTGGTCARRALIGGAI